MGRRMIKLVLVAWLLATMSFTASAVTVLDPQYKAEVYATYSATDLGAAHGMAFDPDGNLYVTHIGTSGDVSDGSIHRIAPDGSSQLFADGLRFPGNIVWGGGTAYGNYLYVGDAKAGDVLKFDLAGNSTSFARPRREPYALGISNSGNLYCGTRVDDHVDYISPGGVVNNFSNFPYNMPGGPTSIEFDSSGNYGSGLFLSNDGADNDSGIFEINANGIASPFAPDIVTSFRLGFDDAGLFGYSLFTTGMTEFGQLWSMYSIDADGVATQFAHNNSTHLTIFSFGPDGAMYVAEHDGMDTTIISRIALIPEPVTFALLSIGGVLVRMRTRRS